MREVEAWGAEALVVKGDVPHDSRQHEYDVAGPILSRFPGPPTHPRQPRRRQPLPRRPRGGAPRLPGSRARHDHRTAPRRPRRLPRQHRTPRPPAPLPSCADDPLFALVGAHATLLVTPPPPHAAAHPPPSPTRRLPSRFDGIPGPAGRDEPRHLGDERPHPPPPPAPARLRRAHRGRLDQGSPGDVGRYLVYEGGLIQTVRRITAPDALAWTERTRGAWPSASGGIGHRAGLPDRSFTHRSPPGR